VLYLLALRGEWLPPRFAPVIALGILPVTSAIVGAWALRGPSPARSRHGWLVALAVLEMAWAVVVAAMVGFAIAWRSG
jgi:hypothetical protein